MRRMPAVLLGVLIAVCPALMAPTGGLPSRPRFQVVTALAASDQGGIKAEAAQASFGWRETDAAANNGNWVAIANGEALTFYVANDAYGAFASWLQVDRTANTVDAIALSATSITANGASLLETSGTFVASFDDACTTTPTITFDWVKFGSQVTLVAVSASGWACTSDSTSTRTTGTPVPASIRPAYTAVSSGLLPFQCLDNGTGSACFIQLSSAGNITFMRLDSAFAAANWTAAGNKLISSGNLAQFTYMLLNP